MKSITQIVVLVVVVVGGIAGVTFVSQYDWLTKKKSKQPSPQSDEPVLAFPMLTAQGDFTSEIGATGYHDFVFQNRQSSPVDLYLKFKSCRCSSVEVGFLRPEDWQYLVRTSWMSSLMNSLLTHGVSLDRDLLCRQLLEQNLAWQSLTDDGKKLVVPAADGPNLPTVGLARVRWRGEKLGPHALGAELQAIRVRQQDSAEYKLQVSANFVPALDVVPPTVRAGELTARGQARTLEFYCYSSTRDRFPLTAKESQNDPRFVCSCTPLTEVECQAMQIGIGIQTSVRCAYRINVTVHERLSDKEPLDIGYFRRELVLTSDVDLDPLRIPLTGMVRGEVTVGSGGDRDQIDLGLFAAQNGQSKTIAISTEQPKLQLQVAEKKPKFLEVRLEETGREGGGVSKRWSLKVTVPPNQSIGRLPDESCVVLLTNGTPPRRVRIPVKGNAYRSAAQK